MTEAGGGLHQMQLILGDCIEEMKNIKDKSVDIVLTDPPYGTTACKWDSIVPFSPMWKELKRITKGPILIFGTEPFSSALRMSNIKEFKYDWIFEKSEAVGHLNAKKQPLRAHEVVSVFYNKQVSYFPQMSHGHTRKVSLRGDPNTPIYGQQNKVPYDSTSRYPRSVLKFSKDKQKEKFHPTQKPVSILEYFIKTYSVEGETVLDFTMGSGSTGVACKNLGRKFIGIENDECYFNIAEKRIKNMSVIFGNEG